MMKTSGIRTIEDLKQRCWIDDDTGCWHWRGATNGRVPSTWFPAVKRVSSLPYVICHLTTGSPPRKGQVWHCRCETPFCANPDHRKPGTRSSQMKALKLSRPPLVRAQIAATKRAANRSRLTQEEKSSVYGSVETLASICSRLGISQTYASNLRAGKKRGVRAAPNSSVFNMNL